MPPVSSLPRSAAARPAQPPARPVALGRLCLLGCLALGAWSGAAEPAPEWQSLFDGRQLGQWKPTPFGGEGEVTITDGGLLRIARGADLSGITWEGEFPRQDFEIALEARRVDGSDFFCGLTFPVGEDHCSLILGGWGGGVIGLSCIDGDDAANNATMQIVSFDDQRWYAVRVRVTPERISCFLDDEQIVDLPLEGQRISVRDEVIPSQPLGIATYATTAELRHIRWRLLPPPRR